MPRIHRIRISQGQHNGPEPITFPADFHSIFTAAISDTPDSAEPTALLLQFSGGGTMDNRPNPIRGPSTCKTDDTMEVTNPAEFLRNERGVFEVISPYGHVFSVTCRFGSRMNIREISEPKSIENQQRLTWKIRRVNSNVA